MKNLVPKFHLGMPIVKLCLTTNRLYTTKNGRMGWSNAVYAPKGKNPSHTRHNDGFPLRFNPSYQGIIIFVVYRATNRQTVMYSLKRA
jgi:hypothetical protein